MKRNEEEFVYLMKFYQIDKMPIYYEYDKKNFKGEFVGRMREKVGWVDINLRYDKKNCWHSMANYEDAKNLALEQIDEYIEKVKKFRSKDVVTLQRIETINRDVWNYADEDGVVRHHVYPTKEKTEKFYELTGTYDEVFEKAYREENRLRYCNDTNLKFADESVQELYWDWHKFISEGRSMSIYYGGGVVD